MNTGEIKRIVVNGREYGIEDEQARQMVAEEIAKVIGGAPETFDTLREIADYIEAHGLDMAEIIAGVEANAKGIKANADAITDEASRAKVAEKANADAITNNIAANIQLYSRKSYELTKIEENYADSGGKLRFYFQKTGELLLRGYIGGKYVSRPYIFGEEYRDAAGNTIVTIPAGKALVGETNSGNILIISNSEVTDKHILFASCSYGIFIGGLFSLLIERLYNDNINSEVDVIKEELSDAQDDIKIIKSKSDKNIKTLYIDKLLNKDTASGNIDDDPQFNDKRVVTSSVVCVPYTGAQIRAKMPDDYTFYFWVGRSDGVINTTSGVGWLVNGSEYTFPDNIKSYRIVFKKKNESNISADEVMQLIADGTIALELVNAQDDNVIQRNRDKEVMVGAVKKKLWKKIDSTTNSKNDMNQLPVLAHISDLHGDAVRLQNFMKYCDYIGVDAALATGDVVMYRHQEGTVFQDTIAEKHNTPYCYCIGNHEAYPSGVATLYEDNIANLAVMQNYLISEGEITDQCYWYKDFPNKSIRVIAINYYENGVYNGKLGQAQLEWLVSTLTSTPQGYGVVVMLHSPEDKVVAESPYDVFRQNTRIGTYQEDGFYVGNRPVSKIIDAFISHSSVTIQYTDNGEAVNVAADFTAVAEGVEFIAYTAGHRHEDWIGYYANSTNKQLCLGVTAGIALYGDTSNSAWANQEDLPRGGEYVYQDAFNIYAIDRERGVVKVVRIGSSVTDRLAKREMMEIPYRV